MKRLELPETLPAPDGSELDTEQVVDFVRDVLLRQPCLSNLPYLEDGKKGIDGILQGYIWHVEFGVYGRRLGAWVSPYVWHKHPPRRGADGIPMVDQRGFPGGEPSSNAVPFQDYVADVLAQGCGFLATGEKTGPDSREKVILIPLHPSLKKGMFPARINIFNDQVCHPLEDEEAIALEELGLSKFPDERQDFDKYVKVMKRANLHAVPRIVESYGLEHAMRDIASGLSQGMGAMANDPAEIGVHWRDV